MKIRRSGFVLFGLLFFGCSSTGGEPGDVAIGLDRNASDTHQQTEEDQVQPPVDVDLSDLPVDQAGSFNVGYRTLSITYMPPVLTETRTIELHIWYPTLAESGEAAVYQKVFEDPESFLDAPLAAPKSAEGYPLHIHSHGDKGFGATSAFMMRRFASHGWVAVAPDHTLNTIADSIEPKPMSIFFLRGTDIIATLDALNFLGGEDPLKGILGTDNVLLSGHSFGAHTCWSVAGATFDMSLIPEECSGIGSSPSGECTIKELGTFEGGLRDSRVSAILIMDGIIRSSMFGTEGHKSVEIPVLFMNGKRDIEESKEHFESAEGMDFSWVEIKEACHQSFALGFCETLDTDLGYEIVNTYALAFARKHILGVNDTLVEMILNGEHIVSEKATFKKHP